ncbi:MAG TPA: DegT/DnrJ/EryC1/StrS family aminotransferase [Longimicrobiaceae bacterium]|nr:DegT/DnrJ/EryC1/StrS family aminotransferase [Longimicrobiaceae bacterium]
MEIRPTHIEFTEEDRRYILERIGEKLARGYISQGEAVAEFEAEFARHTGARHAVALSSGSAAIEIAMRIREVAGSTVLVPANTNFATAVGPLRAGARVALVDVDPATFSPGVAELERAWVPGTSGLILVHMGGIVSPEVERIRDWCAARGMWLLEDCAHAHGSRLGGVHAGRFGFAGAFSFFATKVITSAEGGMLVTEDDEVAEEARLHRNLGKPSLWENYHLRAGTNARMSELNAVVGVAQLRRLDEFIAARARIAECYTRLLADGAATPVLPAGPSSWYKYPVLLPPGVRREEVKEALRERGVHPAGEIYERPLHHQPVLAREFAGQRFPNAEEVCARHLCLPIHPGITPADAEYVAETLTRVLPRRNAA